MKLFPKPLLAISILFLFLSFSCNNEEDPSPEEVNKNKTEAFLAGESSKAWILEKVSLHKMDITSLYLSPCDRDDPYVLYRDGNGEQRSGDLECTENDPEILREGSWVFDEKTSSLSLYLGDVNRRFTLLEINEAYLEMELEEDGNTYHFNFKALE